MRFTKELSFDCNGKKVAFAINCNCQNENSRAEENEKCCQVEVTKCDCTEDNGCNCSIEVNCNCESSCC